MIILNYCCIETKGSCNHKVLSLATYYHQIVGGKLFEDLIKYGLYGILIHVYSP